MLGDLLKHTGADFSTSATLKDLQKLNNKINDIVDIVNLMQQGKVDINIELGDASRTFTLQEAATVIMNTRRALGQKIRFKKTGSGKYVEFSYIGTTLDNEAWTNEENWETGPEIIDGGEFES